MIKMVMRGELPIAQLHAKDDAYGVHFRLVVYPPDTTCRAEISAVGVFSGKDGPKHRVEKHFSLTSYKGHASHERLSYSDSYAQMDTWSADPQLSCEDEGTPAAEAAPAPSASPAPQGFSPSVTVQPQVPQMTPAAPSSPQRPPQRPETHAPAAGETSSDADEWQRNYERQQEESRARMEQQDAARQQEEREREARTNEAASEMASAVSSGGEMGLLAFAVVIGAIFIPGLIAALPTVLSDPGFQAVMGFAGVLIAATTFASVAIVGPLILILGAAGTFNGPGEWFQMRMVLTGLPVAACASTCMMGYMGCAGFPAPTPPDSTSSWPRETYGNLAVLGCGAMACGAGVAGAAWICPMIFEKAAPAAASAPGGSDSATPMSLRVPVPRVGVEMRY